ncbi:MAG: hypothetical protein AB4426_30520 [Xenococcaceae cyanobacterium]
MSNNCCPPATKIRTEKFWWAMPNLSWADWPKKLGIAHPTKILTCTSLVGWAADVMQQLSQMSNNCCPPATKIPTDKIWWAMPNLSWTD